MGCPVSWSASAPPPGSGSSLNTVVREDRLHEEDRREILRASDHSDANIAWFRSRGVI